MPTLWFRWDGHGWNGRDRSIHVERVKLTPDLAFRIAKIVDVAKAHLVEQYTHVDGRDDLEIQAWPLYDPHESSPELSGIEVVCACMTMHTPSEPLSQFKLDKVHNTVPVEVTG